MRAWITFGYGEVFGCEGREVVYHDGCGGWGLNGIKGGYGVNEFIFKHGAARWKGGNALLE